MALRERAALSCSRRKYSRDSRGHPEPRSRRARAAESRSAAQARRHRQPGIVRELRYQSARNIRAELQRLKRDTQRTGTQWPQAQAGWELRVRAPWLQHRGLRCPSLPLNRDRLRAQLLLELLLLLRRLQRLSRSRAPGASGGNFYSQLPSLQLRFYLSAESFTTTLIPQGERLIRILLSSPTSPTPLAVSRRRS